MAKGKKDRPARQVQHLEEFQRMNFLYQAAALMTAATADQHEQNDSALATPATTAPRRRTPRCKPRAVKKATRNAQRGTADPTRPPLAGLGCFYVSTLKTVARRNVLRLDPSMKRTLCRRCDALLLPGVSATVRFEDGANPAVTTRCQLCHAKRRLPTHPAKQLFCERPENIVGAELPKEKTSVVTAPNDVDAMQI
ncbi:RNAse P Rpr2/Rpp21/SNM1 subunit domain-containing protein [Thamnocephalis sphaerospora]|uniref:RNAse P Rpr2/Rpp21/SNM1 subunit domain-containing protein n=1 Tax=Thamnocephalis sphaerospora TaxID=78915 RepID=A0A4P9XL44_9FUNG|nr:RNAse P Rpr2/Rpp21/SNM1 subunit domain-containing protein [Thamnocephalis sphaerospora]|eukprot:RKP06558.1 RNAse P Rpr2/Rpp21/SNM1 subunit domain-containing protein [Thamnocephalis sphaerospora]